MTAEPTWNLQLVMLAKEFVFDVGLPGGILFICCVFLWLCIFKKIVKLAITLASLFIIFACYFQTPRILINYLLSEEDRNLTENFVKSKNLIALPPSNCVEDSNNIVVLGGGFATPQIPSYATQFRLLGLSSLLKKIENKQVSKKKQWNIFFSGGVTSSFYPKVSEAQAMKEFALKIERRDFLDKYKLFLEEKSKNSYQNALFTRELFTKNEFNSHIVLITSTYHMYRAKRVFEKQGFKVCPVSVTELGLPGSGFINFSNGAKTASLLNEYFGVLGYSIKGWL